MVDWNRKFLHQKVNSFGGKKLNNPYVIDPLPSPGSEEGTRVIYMARKRNMIEPRVEKKIIKYSIIADSVENLNPASGNLFFQLLSIQLPQQS